MNYLKIKFNQLKNYILLEPRLENIGRIFSVLSLGMLGLLFVWMVLYSIYTLFSPIILYVIDFLNF